MSGTDFVRILKNKAKGFDIKNCVFFLTLRTKPKAVDIKN